MSETLSHYQTANRDIVNLAAMSLCAAPGLTEAERTMRSETVIQGAMAFQTTDPAQTMLCTLIVGHYVAIMDGFRDIGRLTLTPAEAARARMVTVAQTKLLPQLLREMHVARTEVLPKAVDEPVDDAGYEATLAKFRSAYTESLATLASNGTLTPAANAREMLGAPREEAAPVTGSRAQRRAMMKRNGGFKRNG
jgi:hypothetical protein